MTATLNSESMQQRMGHSEPDQIVVRGLDLCEQVIGTLDFGGMVFLEIVGRTPSSEEAAMVNAVLVTLTEHGITANSLAARLTYLAAPEAMQGAVAAGILGAGSRFLGAIEECARTLQSLAGPGADGRVERVRAYVEQAHRDRLKIAGIGHPVHKPDDPRTERLYRLADELGIPDAHRSLTRELRVIAEETFGRVLPINADGAIAAILSDMGFPWQVCRGFAIIARSAGLVGHVWDEIERPIAWHVWTSSDRDLDYVDPEPMF